MKKTAWIWIFILSLSSCVTRRDKLIIEKDIERIISYLSSDEMQGRATYSIGINKAARFIEKEFKEIGLLPLPGEESLRQIFYDTIPTTLPIEPSNKELSNIVGIIPGRTKAKELIIFSAHYDHLGIIQPVGRDSIANGADDNASGITGIIALAKYFKKLNNNERTLIFAAFAAEEIGGLGAAYFSKKLHSQDVIAMFNIEMIGKESKFGKNTAYITGYEKSDFGEILQRNLQDSKFRFYPDPYPEQQLFYRSDNKTLAVLGVPAHTISTTQIDTDNFYHTVDDELGTINIKNLISTINGIAIGSKTIISGQDTPKRIKNITGITE